MRERPILMSGPMVRALVDGRKTQTRRAVKVQPRWVEADNAYHAGGGFRGTPGWRWTGGPKKNPRDFSWAEDDAPTLEDNACPYGIPGDRFWVREAWKSLPGPSLSRPYDPATEHEFGELPRVLYRADPAFGESSGEKGWKPSIHMPRWASRLTLEVTGVRVERVQDISWGDAVAEGCKDPRRAMMRSDPAHPRSPVRQYRALWDSLNATRGHGWAANPWVWVVEFQRVAP